MANNFVKAEQVVAQALGVLERDTVLAQFTWRDLQADRFRGAKNDTVTLKVPAYTTARTRVMRSDTAIVVDELDETSVDITLDTHVYKAIGVRDEEMTLDIMDFGEQVTAPAMGSVVRKVDELVGAEMAAASPEVEVTLDEDDPYASVVDVRTALNLASVPAAGRFLAAGANVEAAILKSPQLRDASQSASSEALREAIVGRIAGFTVVSAIGLDPDVAIAAHRTAFPLALVAPEVPAGASWGAKQTYRGLQLRVLRDYDPTGSNGPVDRLLTDTFMGVGTTMDRGTIDADGRFVPSVDGSDDPILVRAVKLVLAGS
jgi:hypothetical protein